MIELGGLKFLSLAMVQRGGEEMIQRFREMDRTRWFDQVVGALAANFVLWVVAYMGNFVTLPADVRELKANAATKADVSAAVSTASAIIKEDMDKRTTDRKNEDARLEKRQDASTADHMRILAEHQEILKRLPVRR